MPLPHAGIRIYVEELLASLRFTGMIGLDIIEAQDGSLWPIEANPRATSGVHLFADDGTDWIAAFLGERAEPLGSQDTGSMVGFAMPTWGVADAWRNGKLMELPGDMWRSREVVWRWSDPLPALTVFPAMAEFAWIAWRQRITLHQATTQDLEWNGEEVRNL